MKINKENIPPEDKELAVSILNHLRNKQFVIGNPGLGLKKTLVQLENKRDSKVFSITDWKVKDAELESQISLTKAGIEGEEKLCEYLATLFKYDKNMFGIVAFASLSYDQESNDKEYIPDTDTLLVYGKNLLVIDAKNLKTKPNKTYMLCDGWIIDDSEKPLTHVNPSTYIWLDIFSKAGIEIESIDGYVCIVNDSQVDIFRNPEWYESHTKLIHISELHQILSEWVQGKDDTLYLDTLTEIAKTQIRQEKDISLDINEIKKKFGV